MKEIAAVQKAWLSFEREYEAGITFLVVQKRHHTRLFCADSKDEVCMYVCLCVCVPVHICACTMYICVCIMYLLLDTACKR